VPEDCRVTRSKLPWVYACLPSLQLRPPRFLGGGDLPAGRCRCEHDLRLVSRFLFRLCSRASAGFAHRSRSRTNVLKGELEREDALPMLRESDGPQRPAYSPQSLPEHFRVHSHADTEVIGQTEKMSGHS
jgi:hypothetical protein